MSGLANATAIVTGASRGIGEAIARRLSAAGAEIVLAGRRLDRLSPVRDAIVHAGGRAVCEELDLADSGSIERFVSRMGERCSALRALVNCGGIYSRGTWEEASADTLAALFETNVRGPYALTRGMLPSLIRAEGDVVFVNSSVIHSEGKCVGQFAATNHALKGLTDSLRAEINEKGVRVMSLHPGRTATPRQEEIHEMKGEPYRPERLLQPDDVAQVVVACLQLPDTAEVTELRIRPRYKS